MNEDQAGQAHLQILRCYFLSQRAGEPWGSPGRVALTRPSGQIWQLSATRRTVIVDIKGFLRHMSRCFHPGTDGSGATATIGTADRSHIWAQWMEKSWWQQRRLLSAAYRESFLHRVVFGPKRRDRHADRMHFWLETSTLLKGIRPYDRW